MTHLIKIGNSQGIRIPKPLIAQACLTGKALKLVVVKDGLLVAPQKMAREGWEEQISSLLKTQGKEAIDTEWLDAPLSTDEEWEW